MAGIGFELRRLLARDSYAGLLGAYGYAGLVSSGPWVLSIGGVLTIGAVVRGATPPGELAQFQVAVTWLMASSLLLTAPLQFVFGRHIADRIYQKQRQDVLPNLLGALTIATLGAGTLATAIVFQAFPIPFASRALLVASLVALCDGWVLVVLLSGAKAHRTLVGLYLVAWLTTLALAWALRSRGFEGLMAGFAAGQGVATFSMIGLAMHAFPGERRVRFDFLRRVETRRHLALTGALFYAGVWADKLVFWICPVTSEPVLGPLRSSIFYDLPLFLAYLSSIPAMAVLFLRLEAGFADRCQAFFESVQEGAPLQRLEAMRAEMAAALGRDLLEISIVQGLAFLGVLAFGPELLRLIGASPLYLGLLWVGAAGVSLQVPFLAALNVLFYLDRRRDALLLVAFFAVANLTLSAASVQLGPDWYGLGFAAAALLTTAAALPLLWRRLGRLERDTFMQQPLWPPRARSGGTFAALKIRAALQTAEDGGGTLCTEPIVHKEGRST
jgi:uncharacterized membrane protein